MLTRAKRGRALVISVIAAGLLCLSGCMGALYDKEAEMHYDSAQSHEAAGKYYSARIQYCGAMARAERGDVTKAGMSMLTYDCGRTSAYVCDFPRAEKYLLKSLELETEVSGPDSPKLAPRLFELARLYSYQAKYAESAKYFSMRLPILERIGTEQSDPLGYADALDEYGDVLARLGEAAPSDVEKTKALTMRKNHSGAERHFVPVRYECPQPQ